MTVFHALAAAALALGYCSAPAAQALLAPAAPAAASAGFGIRVDIDPANGRILPAPPLRALGHIPLHVPLQAAPRFRTDSSGTTFLTPSGPEHHVIAHLEPDGSISLGCQDAAHVHADAVQGGKQ